MTRVETGKKITTERKGGSFVIKESFAAKVEEDKSGFARQAR